jgi:hypothetical protein
MIWNAPKGARELFKTYSQLGLSLDDFEGPRYKRIAKLQSLIDSGRVDEQLRWLAPVPSVEVPVAAG